MDDRLHRVEHSNWVDTSTWGIYPKWAREMVQEVVIDQIERDPPRAFLPIQYAIHRPSDGVGGPPVTDPLTVYVSLPLSGDEDAPIYMQTSISRMIADMTEAHRCGTGFVEGGQEAEVFRKLAAALRAAADKVEAAIAENRTGIAEKGSL